jgi:hypothetical protein
MDWDGATDVPQDAFAISIACPSCCAPLGSADLIDQFRSGLFDPVAGIGAGSAVVRYHGSLAEI